MMAEEIPTSLANNSSLITATSNGVHHLVASIRDSFKAPNLKAEESYTSVTKYASHGADPDLTRSLNKSIKVVGRRVDTVRTSFQKVNRAINDPSLALCSGTPETKALLREWQEIEMEFETVLGTSRGVANDGAGMIKDFLSTIIPYLLREGDMAEKRLELREYRKTVKDGERSAGVFAKSFREVSSRVIDFRHKWGTNAQENDKFLCGEIDKLQSDINAASKSISETNRNFSSLLAKKWAGEEQASDPKYSLVKRGLQGFIKEAKRASRAQRKADVQVSKGASEIKRKTDDLIVVWDFVGGPRGKIGSPTWADVYRQIVSDLDAIEGQMKITEHSTAIKMFSERVDRLAVQYYHLMKALQMYGIAMAKEDGAGVPNSRFWRKLIGQ